MKSVDAVRLAICILCVPWVFGVRFFSIQFDQRKIAALQRFPLSFVFFAVPVFLFFFILSSLFPVIRLHSLLFAFPQSKFFSSLLNFLMIFVQHACAMWFYYFVHEFTESRLCRWSTSGNETLSHTMSGISNSCIQ